MLVLSYILIVVFLCSTHILLLQNLWNIFVRFIAPHIFIAGMLSSAPEVGPLKSAVNHGIVSEECFRKTKGNCNGKTH